MRHIILFLIFFITAQVSLAQTVSNDFNIRVYGGIDNIPPTTPTLLTVAPIASNQIDLNWSEATDNFLVGGYVVFRDGSAIATTSLLNYSDTGLLASTTYDYFVRAFDTAFNYSSSSNNLSTTTLAIATPPPEETVTINNQQGTIAKVVIKNFSVDTGLSSTSLKFTTTHPAKIEVRWGKTASYELGYVTSDVYSREHYVLIDELETGTKYNYEIIGYTPSGHYSIIKSDTFTTLTERQTISPSNIRQFKANDSNTDVILSWQLPDDENFSHVRIVRSHLRFPEYPHDGAVVYQGDKTSAVDVNVLAYYSPVYYTAFVFDSYGNVSSGAIALVYAKLDTTYTPVKTDDNTNNFNRPIIFPDKSLSETGIITPEVISEATSSINRKRVTVDMKMPHISEIYLIQNGQSKTLLDKELSLDNNQPFVISIPIEAVSGNLKSIIVTILDPTDNRQATSYLLRINKDKNAYEATVAPMQVVGNSQIKLDIYDYEAFVIGTYQAPVQFVASKVDAIEQVMFPDVFFKHPLLKVVGISFVLLSIILFLLFKKWSD